MDNIIFYNANEEIKDAAEGLVFSSQRPYTLYFPANYDQLGHLLRKTPEALLYYLISELSQEEIMRLRYLIMNFNKIRICLIGRAELANNAWQLNVFHFEESPTKYERLIFAYKKYVHQKTPLVDELIVKHNDDIIRIHYVEITHLDASGNYTLINLKDGRSIIQTRQLGMFDFLTEKDLNFIRIHRSLIVNLRNISRIGNGKISFFGSGKEIDISANLENKLKRTLLGRA